MGAIEHLTIRLPGEVAEQSDPGSPTVISTIWTQRYCKGCELGADGNATSEADEDSWVRREVLPALDRCDADRSRGLTVDQVREHLARSREGGSKP